MNQCVASLGGVEAGAAATSSDSCNMTLSRPQHSSESVRARRIVKCPVWFARENSDQSPPCTCSSSRPHPPVPRCGRQPTADGGSGNDGETRDSVGERGDARAHRRGGRPRAEARVIVQADHDVRVGARGPRARPRRVCDGA